MPVRMSDALEEFILMSLLLIFKLELVPTMGDVCFWMSDVSLCVLCSRTLLCTL